jgi:hypothetical protein
LCELRAAFGRLLLLRDFNFIKVATRRLSRHSSIVQQPLSAPDGLFVVVAMNFNTIGNVPVIADA